MGGSVVVRACPTLLDWKYRIGGVAVLDVVEGKSLVLYSQLPSHSKHPPGSAIDALPHMNSLLNARPDGFDSMEEAIEWQYVPFPSSHMSTHGTFSVLTKAIRNPNSARVSIPSIISPPNSDSPTNPPFQWRTPLRSTAPYWRSQSIHLSFVTRVADKCRRLVHRPLEHIPLSADGPTARAGGYG